MTTITTSARRRRSLLWVPGDQPHKIERAAQSGADVVVLDLEDGVAPDRKAAARDTIAGALRDIDFGGAERLVRVCNSPSLAIDVAAAQGADGLCLPKVERPGDLAAFRSIAHKTLGAVLPILAISAESALGVLSTPLFVAEATSVVAWMWGSEDLATALGCRARQQDGSFAEPLDVARAMTVLLAAATDTQAIDTVYPFFKDHHGLIAECHMAVAAGFSGKGVIHPAQVSVVNEAFTPTAEEVDRAHAVVNAFADGDGVTSIDGHMLDLPHLRAAERLLARARGAPTV